MAPQNIRHSYLLSDRLLGVRSFFIANIDPGFRLTLVIILIGQVLLHLIYGSEVFLYSLHFLPLIIIFASLTTLTRYRKVALVLALLLIPHECFP